MSLVYGRIGLGNFMHLRAPVPLDKQSVIRMNRDTLYSSAVIDLKEPVTISLPETDGRYMSLQVINQDHYAYAVSKPGKYELTREDVGSQYAYLIIRTFIDAGDKGDIAEANRLQDLVAISGDQGKSLSLPSWDQQQLLEARQTLNTLAKLGSNNAVAFGLSDEVDPIAHFVSTAAGWGGMPPQNATYAIVQPAADDGTPHSLTVSEVPVDAFWSITVYNAEGYIEENALGHYSFNNVTASPNKDGSITINFGGCDDGRVNCIPIKEGWNYVARMYEPHQEILEGAWKFPAAAPRK